MNVAEVIADILRNRGLTHVFGVGGANIEGLFVAIHQCSHIKVIIAKHEAAAIQMAEGYFRATGKPGVVLVTSGGGAFNTLGALTEALSSDIPLLLIAGQIPSSLEGCGGFQDSSGRQTPIDAENIFETVCRKVVKLRTPDAIGTVLGELLHTAESERGPVVLLISRDTLEMEAASAHYRPQDGTQSLAEEPLRTCLDLMRHAQTITVIGGKSVLYEQCQEYFQSLVRAWDAWVVLTPDGKGLWDHSDSAFAGVLGAMGHAEALDALRNSDLIICIGTRLPIMSRIPTIEALQGKTIIAIHRQSSFLLIDGPKGASVHQLLGPLPETLAYLLDHAEPRSLSVRPKPDLSFLDLSHTVPSGNVIGFKDAMEVIASFLDSDVDVCVDAGNIGAAAIHYLPATGRNIFSVALGMGGMGHSFGCAVGCCLGSGRRTLALAGDGSFYMHGSEIHTAWNYDLPILFIIFNNNAHAMCHIREEVYFGHKTQDNVFKSSHPAAGVGAMYPGLSSYEVFDAESLRQAISESLNRPGPACISLTMSPEEMPPFRPFLSSNQNQGSSR